VRFARSKKGVLKPHFMEKHKNCCFESFCLSFKPLLFFVFFSLFCGLGFFYIPLLSQSLKKQAERGGFTVPFRLYCQTDIRYKMMPVISF